MASIPGSPQQVLGESCGHSLQTHFSCTVSALSRLQRELRRGGREKLPAQAGACRDAWAWWGSAAWAALRTHWELPSKTEGGDEEAGERGWRQLLRPSGRRRKMNQGTGENKHAE